MPPRSKSSAKTDSLQLEAGYTRRTTKRLRVDSDDEEDGGYEPQRERRTSYNESFTRGGARGSSPPAQGKRQKVSTPVASGSEDGEESDYDARIKDYNNTQRKEEEEEDQAEESARYFGEGDFMEENQDARDEQRDEDEDDNEPIGGRLSKKRRASVSSPLTWRDSSPPPVPQNSTAASSSGHAQSNTGGRTRRASFKAKQMATDANTTSTPAKKLKGKRKPQTSESSRSFRSRREATWSESEGESEEEYNGHEDEEVNVDGDEEEDEARLTDDYNEFEEERPARGKKGRSGAGAKGGKAREKETDMTPILNKAKFEGNPAGSSTTTTITAGTKRPRGKKLAGEDTTIDIMDEYGTPDPSSIGSPTATTATDGGKDDTPASSAPPAKKRKLPTIKKVKTAASLGGAGSGGTGTGPGTPVSGSAIGSKPSAGLPQPQPGGTSKLGIADTKARPKTNATSDLDLSNPSLYAELFKNPGGNTSRTGLNRRAKEEERKKELDKMKEEYKVQFVEESKKSFDLQGQAEKMARFEEVLRHRRSSALYPNFLAAKWREEWEREKRRTQRRDYQPPPPQPNGHVDNTKEEGEM